VHFSNSSVAVCRDIRVQCRCLICSHLRSPSIPSLTSSSPTSFLICSQYGLSHQEIGRNPMRHHMLAGLLRPGPGSCPQTSHHATRCAYIILAQHLSCLQLNMIDLSDCPAIVCPCESNSQSFFPCKAHIGMSIGSSWTR